MLLGVVPFAVASLLLPGPAVAVASDGPYVAVAEGHSARDCDRVSVWYSKHHGAVRLGRATRCAADSRVAALSIARDRALWLERESATKWSVWTATVKQRASSIQVYGTDCPRTVALTSGERLLAASGGRLVIGGHGRIRVLPGCRSTAVLTVAGTFASLDNDRLTFARGRRVTTEILFS